jgi:hypothetical protein
MGSRAVRVALAAKVAPGLAVGEGGLGCSLTGITICFRNSPGVVMIKGLELSNNAVD